MNLRVLWKVIQILSYILAMIIVATLAICYASGYRYSFSNRRVYKVSIVHLVTDSSASIYVNGQKQDYKTPKPIYLEPGHYNIELKKDGYISYFDSFSLDSGQLYEQRNIILFKDKIQPEVSATSSGSPNSSVDESLANSSSLIIAYDHEIWSNNKLVTRLSKIIRKAVYYTDTNYIIYQTEDEIGVIRVDGKNNAILFNYRSSLPVNISFKNRGQIVQLIDETKLVTATIR